MSNNSALKSKHCDYTWALSDPEQCERLTIDINDFPCWAYIIHEPDTECGHLHYHFYIHLTQPMSIQALSDKLDIPAHMIEWVRSKTRMIQYLIHKNNPEKKQYSESDLYTNNREYIHNFLEPSTASTDIFSEYKALSDVASGLISPNEYLKLHSDSISSLPFYSRSIFLMRLFNLRKENESPNDIRRF